MRKRLLFVWELGARYGHLAKIFPIARTLKPHGHHLTLAAKDPLASLKSEPTLFDCVLPAPHAHGPPRPDPATFADIIAPHGFDDPVSCAALLRAWLHLFDLTQPDLIIADYAPGALTAAHLSNRRAVTIGTSWSQPPSRPDAPWPSVDFLRPAPLADRTRADAALYDVIAAAAQTLGLRTPISTTACLSGCREHLMTWPELDHYGPRPDAYYYGPGNGFSGGAHPAWPTPPGSESHPKIVVYLPHDAAILPGLLAALGTLHWPTLLHTNGPLPLIPPPCVTYSPSPLDMSAILPQANLLISRGGHGLMAQAVRLGIPQLHFPDTLEAGIVANRLAAAGAAVVRPSHFPAADLPALLTQIHTHTPLHHAARTLGARYQSYNPDTAITELVADLLDYDTDLW